MIAAHIFEQAMMNAQLGDEILCQIAKQTFNNETP
jgi:hypothetical protein